MALVGDRPSALSTKRKSLRVQIGAGRPAPRTLADPKESLLTRVARVGMSDEFADFTLYDLLSKRVDPTSSLAEALRQLSATERKHYEFWKRYVPGEEPRFSGLKLHLILLLQRLFGLTFSGPSRNFSMGGPKAASSSSPPMTGVAVRKQRDALRMARER